MKTDRRTFIKYASAILGGSVLAACGVQEPPLSERRSDASGEALSTPNGFRFYALKQDGDPLPNGHRIDTLRYDAVIADNGQIAYSAIDEEGRVGLYRLQVDTSGERPRVIDERAIVRELDSVPGGLATPVGGYHINGNGDVVMALETLLEDDPIPNEELEQHIDMEYLHSDGFMLEGPGSSETHTHQRDAAIYRASASRGMEVLVRSGTVTDAGHVIVGRFGPAVMRGGELLFTAWVNYFNADTETYELGHGLWYLGDTAQGAEQSVLLQRTGIMPDGVFGTDELSTETVVHGLGLIDLQPGGAYSVQAHTALPDRMQDETRPDGEQSYMGSLLMTGNARRAGSAQVLVAPREIGIEPASGRDSVGYGMALHGPRIAPNGTMGSVITLSEELQRLYYGGTLVASSGDLTPSGKRIESFMTPAFGPEGEMYVVATTPEAMELMLFDGVTLRTLLASNDTLVGETTPVGLITLGTLIRHVSNNTELAFTVAREDGSTALVIGVPV